MKEWGEPVDGRSIEAGVLWCVGLPGGARKEKLSRATATVQLSYILHDGASIESGGSSADGRTQRDA